MSPDFEVDFVITWVNGKDPAWIQEYNEYAPKDKCLDPDASAIRFRDYGLLKYWFRGVEKYTPWIRKVFFVTCGQTPNWLNTSNSKLQLIDHKDYIPPQYLPTFSSNAIELPLYKIPGLSEHFVYFNDDCFPISACNKSIYFDSNGLPRDAAIQNIISCDGASIMLSTVANNLHLLNTNFHKQELMRTHFWKWFNPSYGLSNLMKNLILGKWKKFVGFANPHSAQPYLKSNMEDCWNHCSEAFLSTRQHRFRSTSDINIWIFRYWRLCQGKFSPFNPYKFHKYYELGADPTETICNAIESQHYKTICINDGQNLLFEQSKKLLEASFQMILPEKCSFEK